jgi:hypothetical protein
MSLIQWMAPVSTDDIAWAQALTAPDSPEDFALETVFVICNSGMRYTVARRIYARCSAALFAGLPVAEVFKHAGKAAAIEKVWAERVDLYRGFLAAAALDAASPSSCGANALGFLETLPWIGGITKYHLAKNFGVDVAKPDVHLVRLADREECTVQAMCQRLASETGFRVATVDTLLWRACADGWIDSRTGAVNDKRRGDAC